MAADYSAIFGDNNWMNTFMGKDQQSMLTTPNLANDTRNIVDTSGYAPPSTPPPGATLAQGAYNRETNPFWKALGPQRQAALASRYATPEQLDQYIQSQTAADTRQGTTSYQDIPYGVPSQSYPGGTPSNPTAGGTTGVPGATGNLTATPGGPASDLSAVVYGQPLQEAGGGSLLDQLNKRYAQQAGAQDQTVADFKGRFDPALAAILARSNTAEGFSPETLSALRSQATSTIPKQYEDAARAERLNLLRSGAIGAGELPGSAGDVLRTMAPLDQARAESVAGANRSNIIANEAEQKRTLDLNRTRGQEALNQLTGATNMIADIQDPYKAAAASATQQGLNNQLDIAKLNSATQLQLGQLDATTRTNIANMDNETQKWVSGLSADTQKTIANLDAASREKLGQLDADTRLQIAKIDNAPGSLKSLLTAGLVSMALAPGAGGTSSLASKGFSGLIDLVTGKPNDAAKAAVEAALGAGAQGPLLTGAGTAAAAAGAATPLTGYAGGGLVTTHGALIGMMTNPITIGVAGALVAGALWLKSQAHFEANTMVKDFEQPFAKNVLAPFATEFDTALNSGNLNRTQAQTLRNGYVESWNDYVDRARTFGTGGSDEKKVSDQSILNLWTLVVKPEIDKIDSKIGQLA